MPRATLHYGGRSPVVGAWDARSTFMIWIAEVQTRSRKMAPGISSGDNQSQDTSCASRLSVVSLPYSGRLSLIGQCRETRAK